MPDSSAILNMAERIANDWRSLAIVWHLTLAAAALALAAGARPSNRTAGGLLAVPLASVSAHAWVSGNPFNGTIFGLLVVVLAAIARQLSAQPVRFASARIAWFGIMLIAFGSTYPHFLHADSWVTFLYAAPFGLIPCPTLTAVIGFTLMLNLLESTGWSLVVAAAGVVYGTIGVFKLGVTLDYGLLAGAIALTGVAAARSQIRRSVRARDDERTSRLPGDDLISEPLGSLTHAISIRRARADVWPWIAQMGAGNRAGWYSYDMLDNGRQRSADHVIPELQHLDVGMIFPWLPGATDGFTLLAFEPSRFLLLGAVKPGSEATVTWVFVLVDEAPSVTRLIARARGGREYRFHTLPWWLGQFVVRAVHFVMQRKQLLGIAARAEAVRPHQVGGSPQARAA